MQLQSQRLDNFDLIAIATAKKATSPTASKKAAKTAEPAAKRSSKPAPAAKTASSIKPVKDTFTKAALLNHLAEQAAVDKKTVQAVLAALESVVLGGVDVLFV